jgi:hypothetical protein
MTEETCLVQIPWVVFLLLGRVLVKVPGSAFAAGPSMAETAGPSHGQWAAGWRQWAYVHDFSSPVSEATKSSLVGCGDFMSPCDWKRFEVGE